MEGKEILYSLVYPSDELGFKTVILSQMTKDIKHLRDLGFITYCESIGPAGRKFIVTIVSVARPVVEEFYADRLRSSGN